MMAPLPPSNRVKRNTILPSRPSSKPSKPLSSTSRITKPSTRTSYPTRTTSSDFSTSKRDKRLMRHSTFLHKISTTSPNSSIKKRHRRRPKNKLVTGLDELAAALPDAEDEWEGIDEDGEGEGMEGEGGKKGVMGQVRIRQRSLRSRPGAMRRRERVERMERERFGLNLVQMVGSRAGGGQSSSTGMDVAGSEGGGQDAAAGGSTARWKSLQAHIQSTLEQKKEFVRP